MSGSNPDYIASLRRSSEALRGLRRQLLYLEAEARELNLEIVSNLIGAAAEEVRERLAQNEAVAEETSQQIATQGITSWLRH
ncbi:MAG: hypothetical protein ACFCUQ_22575 [Kiloniellales bacterium]